MFKYRQNNDKLNGSYMKKYMVVSVLSTALLLTGCDFFKQKKEPTEPEKNPVKKEVVADFSCTHPDNVQQVQQYLKEQYLTELDRRLRQSENYEVDQDLLDKINKNLKFELSSIRTANEQPDQATQLNCESQLVVHFPPGLQERAENAYAEVQKNCEECEGERSTQTLKDYLEENEGGLTLANNLLKGKFYYDVTKTDQEGISLSVQNENAVLDGVVFITKNAVQYAAYLKENENITSQASASEKQYSEQTVLAKRAMDIRKKELDEDRTKQVERLNMTWDNFSPEQKTQLQQDQTEWFEKRDVDCKVLSQKRVYDIAENERETYQKHYSYWDDALTEQNQEMQYTRCFNQRTTERVVYLNNVFN